MSRCKFQGITKDQNGRVNPSATVSVFLAGTSTPASIYAAAAGGVAVNSVTSDSTTGMYSFYVDTADYDISQLFKIIWTKTGYASVTYDLVPIYSFSAVVSTDGTFAGNSDTLIPTQKAIKTYAQPLDATLTALAGVTTAADKVIYATGPDTFSTCDFTSFARTLTASADAAAACATLGVAPPGSLIMWTMETPPTGYLECDGSSLSTSTYAGLYAVLGAIYGAADGSHFNIPDYRGRFLRSWAHGSANDPDRATRTKVGATGASMTAGDHVGTEQDNEIKQHNHAGLPTYQSAGLIGGVTTSYWRIDSSSQTATTANAGGNETRSINTNIMFCIKY